MKSILALDLATTTGFAFGVPGVSVRYGNVLLGERGSSVGYKLHAFRRWFVDFTTIDQPWAVVFEAPLNVGVISRIGANESTVRLLFGLAAVAEEAAIDRRIPVVKEVSVQDVRKHFLGQRTFKGGRATAKAAVMARCRQLGWKPQCDNAGDALAIWNYSEAMFSPRTEAQRQMNALKELV